MDCKLIVVFLGLVAVASCYNYHYQYDPCHPDPCGDPAARCVKTGNSMYAYKCVCPEGKKYNHFSYYCVPIPTNGNMADSGILKKPADRKKFLKLLHGIADKGHWVKCVTGSKNGFSAATFHKRCDNKGPTITLVKSGKYIFGGYAAHSWKSTPGYSPSRKCILFSVTRNQKAYSTRKPQRAQYNHKDYLPSFGWGLDLYLSDNADQHNWSYSNFANAYASPLAYRSAAAKAFLAGKSHFKVADYEVYYKK